MITYDKLNSPLTVFKNGTNDFLDIKTINALDLYANIFTLNDLIEFCSDENFEWKLSNIKRLWKWWISKLIKFIKYLKDNWIINNKNGIASNKNEIDTGAPLTINPNVYQTALNLYSRHISSRTVNALNNIQIYSVRDLFENRSRYIYWSKWIGKSWIKEIENFIVYINENFTLHVGTIKNNGIKDILDDSRLINILNFHSIYELKELKPYIEDISKFSKLRYFNDKDFEILKTLYIESSKSTANEEQTFAETFLSLLNNFSEIDKLILRNRILWNVTLSETWEKLWITRERVRQKQKNIEIIIMDHWNQFMRQNPEVLNKLLNLVNLYKFIFLPQDTKLFDFLWFKEGELALLYLSLKWLDELSWEIIDNKIHCIFWSDIVLTETELRNLYDFVNEKIRKNNDDIDIEELFYECKFDNVFDPKFNSWITIKETQKNENWWNLADEG